MLDYECFPYYNISEVYYEKHSGSIFRLIANDTHRFLYISNECGGGVRGPAYSARRLFPF